MAQRKVFSTCCKNLTKLYPNSFESFVMVIGVVQRDNVVVPIVGKEHQSAAPTVVRRVSAGRGVDDVILVVGLVMFRLGKWLKCNTTCRFANIPLVNNRSFMLEGLHIMKGPGSLRNCLLTIKK